MRADPVGVKEDGTTPEHWNEVLRSLDPNIEKSGGDDFADADAATASTPTSSTSSSSSKKNDRPPFSLRSLFSRAKGGARLLQDAGRARKLRRFFSRVGEINALEPEVSAMTDDELRLEAAALRSRALGGDDDDEHDAGAGAGEREREGTKETKKKRRRKPEPLDTLLPRAFALVREASRRTLGLRPYDVQLVGAMVLHEGLVAEMRTGEGKTLVAALAAFLNALTGRGVLVVTVNDYLAKRDREWVGKPLELLGLTTAVVTDATPHSQRSGPLAADVCWITPKLLGFTYLHDNTTQIPGAEQLALRRPLHFAIVDEVDSVLIDECRVPLIISGGPLRGDEGKYEVAQQLFVGEEEFSWVRDEESGRLQRRGTKRDEGKGERPKGPPSSSSSFPFFSERFVEAPSDPLTGEARPGSRGDFVFDRRKQSVSLTTAGAAKAARRLAEAGLLSVPGLDGEAGAAAEEPPSSPSPPPPPRRPPSDIELGAALWQGEDPWGPYVNNALKANALFDRDVHYILRGGEAKIVDGETGRVLPDSRWTDGLHQAVEAKEGLRVRGASATMGAITYQALFRKFERGVCGMSGTALSEAEELHEVYGLGVVPVPPHRPPRRVDHPTRLFFSRVAKEAQIAALVAEARRRGRPVLLGTRSVADSERLSRALAAGLAEARTRLAEDYPHWAWQFIGPDEVEHHPIRDAFGRERVGRRFRPKAIEHRLLNARPERVAEEAAVIAQAGLPGAVTIATSMAGRGTDILLGGNARGLASARLLGDLGFLLGGEAAEAARAAGGGEGGRAAARARQPPNPWAAARAPAASSASSSSVTTLETFGFPEFAAGAIERARACLYACDGCQLPPAPDKGWEGGSQEELASVGDDGVVDDSDPLRLRAERARADIEAALLVAERVRAAFKLQEQQQQQQQQAAGGSRSADGGEEAVAADAAAAFAVSGPLVRDFARASPLVAHLDEPRRELVAAAAVLWAWFDEVCTVLSGRVRRAGGLLVIVAAALDSKRVQDQMIGRCGRQGDPGETFVVIETEDLAPGGGGGGGGGGGSGGGGEGVRAKVAAAERRARSQRGGAWTSRLAEAMGSSRGGVLDFCAVGKAADRMFAELRRLAAEDAGAARRHVKALDEVMGVFRDHVYALRRGLVAGDEAQKRRLLRGMLSSVAADLADAATQGGKLPPEEWDVEALVLAARGLERDGRRSLGAVRGEGGGGEPFRVAVEAWGDFPEGFVPGVSDPELYPPCEFARDVQRIANGFGGAVRAWTPRARVFPGGGGAVGPGGGGGGGDDFDGEHGHEGEHAAAASAARAAEALHGAAVAAAAEALRLGGGSGGGGGESFLLDDATRAFLLRPGRSLRGFSALAGEFGGGDGAEESKEGAKAEATASGNGKAAMPTTRDRNLVAARALALLSARELVRAASSIHPGVAYVLEAHFSLRWGFDNGVFRLPTPTDIGAEVAREVLDEAWGDFLADTRALESAVTLRVFSAGLNPLEEFKLEAGEAFAQLLLRYRSRVAAELLGGPELLVLPKWEDEEEEEEREEERPPSAMTLRLLKEKAEMEEEERKKEEKEDEEEAAAAAVAAAARGDGARAEDGRGGGES